MTGRLACYPMANPWLNECNPCTTVAFYSGSGPENAARKSTACRWQRQAEICVTLYQELVEIKIFAPKFG